jgi:hypothetical protein
VPGTANTMIWINSRVQFDAGTHAPQISFEQRNLIQLKADDFEVR